VFFDSDTTSAKLSGKVKAGLPKRLPAILAAAIPWFAVEQIKNDRTAKIIGSY